MAADRYRDESFWKNKPLTPAQLSTQDVGLETLVPGSQARLEIREVPAANLVLSTSIPGGEKQKSGLIASSSLRRLGTTRTEQEKLANLQYEYGWLNQLRLSREKDDRSACRWIHVSSKFPEYIQGAFVGLSDWDVNPRQKLDALRQLDRCIYDNERHSKHGRSFRSFCKSLAPPQSAAQQGAPLLMSIPFLDWSLQHRETPPLRFHVDPQDIKASPRSPRHPLRSLLQHYYRLEDTADRDRVQVFSRHRPWLGDREVDLQVRQWYGHYPTGVVVDELWILVIDEKHIVTFSSNQTWKARWPPLQLSTRISDVSFRRIRDTYWSNEDVSVYTAFTHAICCLHGAVGMIHRGFWTDMPLPCSERYGGYLSHLQFRLHRSPNTKLVKDLLQIQDELSIVLHITRDQETVLLDLQRLHQDPATQQELQETSPARGRLREASIVSNSGALGWDFGDRRSSALRDDPFDSHPGPTGTYRHQYAFQPPNPLDEILDLLRREFEDMKELRSSSSELATRTVQLVNIRLEDHGRAIIVFTLVTIIFLPLSFISSYFGMNIEGIRDTHHHQKTFWVWAVGTSATVLILSSLLAFYGSAIRERFRLQLERRGLRAHQA